MYINLNPDEMQLLSNLFREVLQPLIEKEIQATSKAAKAAGAAEVLLTVEEVATRLKWSKKTVLKHIASGRLQAKNLAENAERPQYRITEKALQAFLASFK